MDYASPLFNELVFSLATETAARRRGPGAGHWIRMLMTEMNRISTHLLFLATNGMDLGAVSMMIYGWREREEVLRFFETVTGLRMNHNYIRPGGVAADLPDGWAEKRSSPWDISRPASRSTTPDDRPAHLARAPAGRRGHHRRRGPGARRHRPHPALHRLRLGPPPRRALPGLRPVRLRCRRGELRRRLRPLRHPAQRDPRVDELVRQILDRCRRATTGSRTRRSPRRHGPASTSRWRP